MGISFVYNCDGQIEILGGGKINITDHVFFCLWPSLTFPFACLSTE